MTEKPCKFYISGKKCKFGKHCRFLHSQPQELNISESEFNPSFNQNGVLSENNSNIVQSSDTTSFNLSILDDQKDEPVISRIPPHLQDSQLKHIPTCTFFVRNGYCGYGRHCRFYHPDQRPPRLQHERSLNDAQIKEVFDPVYTESEYAESYRGQSHIECPKAPDYVKDLKGIEQFSGSSDNESQKQLCSSFSRHGYCKYGQRCKFLHFYAKKKDTSVQSPRDESENHEGKVQGSDKKKVCRRFKAGYCRWGRRCRYLHPADLMDIVDDVNTTNGDPPNELTVKPQAVVRAKRKPVVPFKEILKRSTATDEDVQKLRNTEIAQLKKRFPSDKLQIIEESDNKFCASFCFTPSDPDWPFDVRNFILEVDIPAKYPMEMLKINLPQDQDMPGTVRRFVEQSIVEWIDQQLMNLVRSDKLEIIFRSLMRWMEKQLEGVVTSALRQFKKELIAKAAGFEFITATELKANVKQDVGETEEKTDAAESQESLQESEKESSNDGDSDENQPMSSANSERKGIEISLKNLQLKEQSGTLLFKKIHISIQCARCKNKSEFGTPYDRLNSIDCTKCNDTQTVRFRSAIAHQFSSVIGYLDLDNCNPFDLILQECQPTVSCMNCNRTTDITGFCSGQPHDVNCRSCHEKLRIAVDAVRFHELHQRSETTDIKQIHRVGVRKLARVGKDPAIQEGKPLPANGACKHYKKSYRWLRFPCCGKTYACDICHNENETDHEMKFANRMICGYCCQEQIYSVEKPCKGCGQLMTKSSGSHWEGGQGCRDKIKMSRGDSQKFSNMGKTLSKQSQKVKDMNSKKKTKLRHT